MVVQRVQQASVTVDGEIIGEIATGLLVLFAVHEDSDPKQVVWIADKLVGLRIFYDDEGKMNRSVQDIGGEILVVSQFTLYGDCSKGRRPSFITSARPDKAKSIYQQFCQEVETRMGSVQTGRFAAKMEVDLRNDGPVTLIINSPHTK